MVRSSVPITRPEVWEEEPYRARLRWQRVYLPPYQRTPLRYRVEMQEATTAPIANDWHPVATNVTDPECTINEISPRKDYHFRIRAETENGEVSEPTPPIQYYRSQLPMTREPFNTGELKPIEYDITFANRTYVEHLTKFVPPRLPLDKPEMVVISPETVELAWKPARIPDAIRHSSNLTYTIEVRNPPSFDWRELVSGLKVLDHTLKNLHPRIDYIFRIRAWNEYGSSEPCLPVSLYRPIEYDENGEYEADEEFEREFELRFGAQVPPKLPMDTPKVSTQTPDSVWFSWLPARTPAYATQAPIKYVIETKELPHTGWNRQVTGLVDTQYLLDGLSPSLDYHIRVRAETEFGISDPTLPIIIQRSKGPSSRRSSTDSDKKSDDVSLDTSYLENITGGVPPRMSSNRPRSSNVRPDGLTLSWSMGRVPRYVKNSVIDYIIEMRELPAFHWMECATDVPQTTYDVTGLKPEKDYMFRVKARNDFGISDPTLPMTLYRERDDYVPQTIRSRSGSRDSVMALFNGSRWSRRSSSVDFSRADEEEVDICIRDKIPTAPEFTSPDSVQYVAEGRKGRITLQVRGFPIPTMHWYKREEKVDYGDKCSAFVSALGQITLELKDVKPDTFGEYKCFAENEHGASSRLVNVKLADPPTLLQPLTDQAVTSRSEVTFTCKVDGTPYPTVKWMKDWRPLTESSRVKVFSDQPNTWSLQLTSTLFNDGGVYACVVENMAGKVTSTARLSVDEDSDSGVVRFKKSPIQDQYHILEELGRGRHGVVRRVVDKMTGLEFAAKFINARSPAQKEFFYSEMGSMRNLNNSKLLKIVDAFETVRCLIIVTELLSGVEVLDKVDAGWTEKEVAGVVKQLLEGLQYQHDQGVLHLDIKPSNVFLGGESGSDVKLIDYGMSRRMEPGLDLLQNYGTVGYASPEQVVNDPVSVSSDIWGVGALTYTLLTGKCPFVGEGERDVIRTMVDCNWSFGEGCSVSASAQDFISKILVRDPLARPSVTDCLHHPWLSAPDGTCKLPVDKVKQFQAVSKVKRDAAAVWTTSKLQSFASLLRDKSSDMHPVVDKATGEVIFPDCEEYADYLGEETWSHWNERYADNPDSLVFPLQDINYTLKQHTRIPIDGEDEALKPITVTPTVTDTAIMFRNKIENTTFQSGEDVTLSCSIISPEFPAVVTWYRDEQLLADALRISATYADGVASLTISNAKDYDAAVYKCVARNKDGRVSCQARLLLGDKPGQPGRPVVSQWSSSEVFLTWRGPANDGNSYILGYRVDYRQTSEAEWTRGPYVVEEYSLLTGLVPSSEYIFRISCHNKFGTSPYSWASLVTKTKEIGAPPVVMTTELKPLLQFGSFTKQQLILPAESRRPSLNVKGEATLHKENPEETYAIAETLSKGAYGEYKLCTSKAGNRVCVLKKVPYNADKHDEITQEFEFLRHLQQSNIIRVIDGYVYSDTFYMVFERLSGMNVVQYLSLRKWYTEDMVARVVMQLLNAVQYLHSLNIVHLNLQPASVVMATRRRLHIKLRDFTLARKVVKPAIIYAKKAGYPDFVAPEVMKGEKALYSADVWSIGALTFLMMSGVSPFAGENVRETASNVVFNRYFASDLYDTASRQAVRFVTRMLMRIPENRPTLDMCFDHRWLQLSDSVMKTRQANVFPVDKLRQFSTEYLQRRSDPEYMDLAALDVEALPKVEQLKDDPPAPKDKEEPRNTRSVPMIKEPKPDKRPADNSDPKITILASIPRLSTPDKPDAEPVQPVTDVKDPGELNDLARLIEKIQKRAEAELDSPDSAPSTSFVENATSATVKAESKKEVSKETSAPKENGSTKSKASEKPATPSQKTSKAKTEKTDSNETDLKKKKESSNVSTKKTEVKPNDKPDSKPDVKPAPVTNDPKKASAKGSEPSKTTTNTPTKKPETEQSKMPKEASPTGKTANNVTGQEELKTETECFVKEVKKQETQPNEAPVQVEKKDNNATAESKTKQDGNCETGNKETEVATNATATVQNSSNSSEAAIGITEKAVEVTEPASKPKIEAVVTEPTASDKTTATVEENKEATVEPAPAAPSTKDAPVVEKHEHEDTTESKAISESKPEPVSVLKDEEKKATTPEESKAISESKPEPVSVSKDEEKKAATPEESKEISESKPEPISLSRDEEKKAATPEESKDNTSLTSDVGKEPEQAKIEAVADRLVTEAIDQAIKATSDQAT